MHSLGARYYSDHSYSDHRMHVAGLRPSRIQLNFI